MIVRTCQCTVGYEHHYDILCGKPAVVLIDRRENGKLAVCADCADDPALYEEVQRNGHTWTVLDEGRSHGRFTGAAR